MQDRLQRLLVVRIGEDALAQGAAVEPAFRIEHRLAEARDDLRQRGLRGFDQFAGEKAEAQMGAGRKSVAITARLQPRDKTLTDKEIEAVAAEATQDIVARVSGVQVSAEEARGAVKAAMAHG